MQGRLEYPPASEAGERRFKSSRPDCWKGEPIGDGSRPENGRAMSLEGSTPSPSACAVREPFAHGPEAEPGSARRTQGPVRLADSGCQPLELETWVQFPYGLLNATRW